MHRSRRLLRTGRCRPRHAWLALPLLLVVGRSVLAGPDSADVKPMADIFSPTPGSDRWAVGPDPDDLYAPQGIHTGGFVVFPRLDIAGRYEDNIFATKDNRQADFATIVKPSISAESTWSRHGLGLQAFGIFSQFAKHQTEDSQQGGFNMTGRLDITGEDYVSQFLSFSRETQDRSEPDDTGTRRPPVFNRYLALTRYAHEFSSFEFRIDGQLQRYEYLEGFDFDRDRTELSIGPRLSYRLSPYFTPFIQTDYLDREFDSGVNRSGVDPDSRTYDAKFGLGFMIDPTLTGEVAAGVFHTDFDDPTLDSITSPLIEGSLSWEVTRLTTITADVSRHEAVSSTTDDSSKIVTSASLRVDHELRRNVLLNGEISYRNEDFQDSDRVDNRLDIEIGGTYLLNPNASLSLDYRYSDRASTDDAGDFTDNLVELTLGLKM